MKFILFALFLSIGNHCFATTVVNCINPQSQAERFVCEDLVLNQLNNQSVISSLEIPEKGHLKKASLERQFHEKTLSCGLDQVCWVEAYQNLIQGYEELKKSYEDKVPPIADHGKNETFWPSFTTFFIIILLLSIFVFFIPSIIAFNRQHRNRWVIFVINIVFGFTLLGWLVALIWALNKIDSPIKGGSKYDPQPHDPTL
jgi:ATP-dependent Zn protease